ncbi:MAG: PqqD family protein, partial [Pseudomonadota bacterium]
QNSGAFILSCVEAVFSSDQIVESLASTYDLSSSDALTATTGFIDQLLANRLVEENSELTPATENTIPEKPAGSYELPELTVYEDMQDLLLLDPIHDTEDEGWPQAMPTTGVTKT